MFDLSLTSKTVVPVGLEVELFSTDAKGTSRPVCISEQHFQQTPPLCGTIGLSSFRHPTSVACAPTSSTFAVLKYPLCFTAHQLLSLYTRSKIVSAPALSRVILRAENARESPDKLIEQIRGSIAYNSAIYSTLSNCYDKVIPSLAETKENTIIPMLGVYIPEGYCGGNTNPGRKQVAKLFDIMLALPQTICGPPKLLKERRAKFPAGSWRTAISKDMWSHYTNLAPYSEIKDNKWFCYYGGTPSFFRYKGLASMAIGQIMLVAKVLSRGLWAVESITREFPDDMLQLAINREDAQALGDSEKRLLWALDNFPPHFSDGLNLISSLARKEFLFVARNKRRCYEFMAPDTFNNKNTNSLDSKRISGIPELKKEYDNFVNNTYKEESKT